jgi:DNA modification methylase
MKPKTTADGITVYCSFDKIVSINELKPNPENPNEHPDEQIDLLSHIIIKNGWRDRITVSNRSGLIVKGHGRYLAAIRAGLQEAPVDFQDYETHADEVADLIADNKISELSEVNNRLARKLIENMEDFEIDMEMDFDRFGFTDDEFRALFAEQSQNDDDEVPQVGEPAAKRGQIYRMGKHRVMCGDCINRDDVAKLLDGKNVDMVFTDPPYGVSYAVKNEYLNAIDFSNRIQVPIENDHKSEKDIQQFWKTAFEVIRDNLAEVNSYYITGPQSYGMMMMMMHYNYKHEPIFFGWTTKHKFYGAGEFQTSVWEVQKPQKSDLHPTMKPVALIVNAIMNSTKNGQIVFDPFLGSGSTLIASEKTGRVCYGMEIDPHYCDVIVRRWEDYTGKKAKLSN